MRDGAIEMGVSVSFLQQPDHERKVTPIDQSGHSEVLKNVFRASETIVGSPIHLRSTLLRRNREKRELRTSIGVE